MASLSYQLYPPCHTSESWYPELFQINARIPAYAGMTSTWIPAFAGMTLTWIPAFAGMTSCKLLVGKLQTAGYDKGPLGMTKASSYDKVPN